MNHAEYRHNLEKQILGELLMLSDNLTEQQTAVLNLEPIDFRDEKHRRIYTAMLQCLHNDKTTFDSVKLYAYVQEPQYIISLTEKLSSAAMLQTHIDDLKALGLRDRIEHELTDNLSGIKQSWNIGEFEKIRDQVITKLSGMMLRGEAKLADFDVLEKRLVDKLRKEKTDEIDGFSWGKELKSLNVYTNGIETSRLFVIGGLKKSGKTRLLVHTILELYQQGIPTAFLSLEVPEDDLYRMLKAASAGIEDAELRSGRLKYLSKTVVQKLDRTRFDQKRLLIECPGGLDIGSVLNRVRMFARMGAKVICIDYAQRIAIDDKRRADELEAVARNIANLTRELDVAVILLSQLSNVAEREVPTVSHLKGSGGIGEAADTIMILDNVYRRKRQEQYANQLDIELTQRYGESGKISIYADLGCFKFRDLQQKSAYDDYYDSIPHTGGDRGREIA